MLWQNEDAVLVGSGVAPLQHALKLLVGPRIQVDRLDSANVRAHATMNTRASTCLISKRLDT